MTIGKWLEKAGRECREQIFLGTKGCLMPRGYNSTRGDLSPERIRNELEESLEALRTDYIDLYWLHRNEEGRDPGEILETMNCLVREGKIRYFGVFNWKASRILEADTWAEARGLQPISASQIQFGFGVCTPDRWGDQSVVCMDSREYAVYRRLQMPVYAYSAQSEGYFARILSGEKEKISEGTLAKYDSSVNQVRARRLKELRELRRNEGRPCPSPEFVFPDPVAEPVSFRRSLQPDGTSVPDQRQTSHGDPPPSAPQADTGLCGPVFGRAFSFQGPDPGKGRRKTLPPGSLFQLER